MLSAFPPSPCPCVSFLSLAVPSHSLLAASLPGHLPTFGFSSYGKAFHPHSRISHSMTSCFPSHLPTSLIAPAHVSDSTCSLLPIFRRWMVFSLFWLLSSLSALWEIIPTSSSYYKILLQFCFLILSLTAATSDAFYSIFCLWIRTVRVWKQHSSYCTNAFCVSCSSLGLTSDLFWFPVLKYWLFDVSELRSFLPSGRGGTLNILWDKSV